MGAISTTTETDIDAIVRNNIRLSIDLWTWCSQAKIPLVYASSAATYGDGREGFLDRFDADYLGRLRPLNPYGWSKAVFDRWVQHAVATGAPCPPRWAGLKFFNVYGPNEYHKGGQRSVAAQLHTQIRESGRVRLFRSENPDYPDGGQLRDFVWVGDCVRSRSGRFRNRAPNPAFTTSDREQRDPSSRWRKSYSRKWTSPRMSSSSISQMHCRANINIIPAEASISCDRRVMRAVHLP